MSDQELIAGLRRQLLDGGRRRHQREQRRRRAVLAIAPAVLVALLLGGLLWVDRGSETHVATEGPPTTAVVAACDALHDLVEVLDGFPDQPVLDERADRVVELARASEDGELVAAAEGLTSDGPDPAAVFPATERLADRCAALGAPGWVPVFVPLELGPEPMVPLDAYGVVDPFLPIEPADSFPPGPGGVRVSGRELSEVQAGETPAGAYLAAWSVTRSNGQRLHCHGGGTPGGAFSGCSPAPEQAPTEPSGTVSALGGGIQVATGPEVAFVVAEAGPRTLVQRPALGRAVFALDRPDGDDRLTVRTFDAEGGQLTCRTGPLSVVGNTPC